jgi:hypothetical protein
VNADDLEVESKALEKTGGYEGYTFTGLKRDLNGVETRYQADLYDHVDIGQWEKPPRNFSESITFYGNSYDIRLVWLALSALGVVLMFWRNQLFSGLNLSGVVAIAMVGLGWGFYTPLSVGLRADGPPALIGALTCSAIAIIGFVALFYSTIFVTERRQPHMASNYSALARPRGITIRPLGLALIRGVASGALLLGIYAGLMEAAIRSHLSWPRLQDYSRDLNSAFPGLSLLMVSLTGVPLEVE